LVGYAYYQYLTSLEKDHGDDGVDHKMIKGSTWKRRKRKTKTS
jgi:hypothetical protein